MASCVGRQDGELWIHRTETDVGPMSPEYVDAVVLRWRLPIALVTRQQPGAGAGGPHWSRKVATVPARQPIRRKITVAGSTFKLTAAPKGASLAITITTDTETPRDSPGALWHLHVAVVTALLSKKGAHREPGPVRRYSEHWFKKGGGELLITRVVAANELGHGTPYAVEPGSFVVDIGMVVFVPDQQVDAVRFSVREGCRQRCGAVGLRNAGSTCYLNALLQLLYHLAAFRSAVFRLGNVRQSGTRTVIQHLFSELAVACEPLETAAVGKSLGLSDTSAEQDAQEVLLSLLDALAAPVQSGEGMSEESSDPVTKLFSGKRQQRIHCAAAPDAGEVREEVFRDIQLYVSGSTSVEEALRRELRPDLLTGANRYDTGDPTLGYQDASRETSFRRFPPVLCLHLRRFEYDVASGSMRKVASPLHYPEEIDLAPFLGESGADPLLYRLYGVITHHGGPSRGHYTTYLRNVEGYWLHFDDEAVTHAETSAALDDNVGGDTIAPDGSVLGGRWWHRPGRCAYLLAYCEASRWSELVAGDDPHANPYKPPTEPSTPPEDPVVEEPPGKEEVAAEAETPPLTFRICTPAALAAQDRIRSHTGTAPGGVFYFKTRDEEVDDTGLTITLPRSSSYGALCSATEEETGLQSDRMRFWRFKRRANDSFRPQQLLVVNGAVPPPYTPLNELFPAGVRKAFLFVEAEPVALASLREVLLVLVKLYDWSRPALTFVMPLLLRIDQQVGDVARRAAALLRLSREEADAMLLFEEVCTGEAIPLEPSSVIGKTGLQSGDVVVLQAPPPPGARLALVPAWLQEVCGRVMVEFVGQGAASGRAPVHLALHTFMTYLQVLERLSSATGDLQPDQLRLGRPTPDGDWRPFAVTELQAVAITPPLRGHLWCMLSSAGGRRLCYEHLSDAWKCNDRPRGKLEVVTTGVGAQPLTLKIDASDPGFTLGEVCEALAAQLPGGELANEVVLQAVHGSWPLLLATCTSEAPVSEVVVGLGSGATRFLAQRVPCGGDSQEVLVECCPCEGGGSGTLRLIGDPFVLVITEKTTAADAARQASTHLGVPVIEPLLLLLGTCAGDVQAAPMRTNQPVSTCCAEAWEKGRETVQGGARERLRLLLGVRTGSGLK
eukprot:Hpha_TRINITY_DN7988_c0_g1::TRINITY_DN7988_c0_g1_i1::g.146023::m.146023/K11838/USP7, UBP15; ubiquitin carboxyl-terminal hydrolase 7